MIDLGVNFKLCIMYMMSGLFVFHEISKLRFKCQFTDTMNKLLGHCTKVTLLEILLFILEFAVFGFFAVQEVRPCIDLVVSFESIINLRI